MVADYLLTEPLAVELMNTVNFADGVIRDELEDGAAVTAWLGAFSDRISSEAGTVRGELGGPAVTGRLQELRDALRRLAADATEDPRPPATSPGLTRSEAVRILNALARAWPELVWPAGGQPTYRIRTTDSTGELAIGLIAHQAVELFAGPDRERLRACLAPSCLLFFFKRNTRRDWCSPACGNRARVARHYQRHQVTRRH